MLKHHQVPYNVLPVQLPASGSNMLQSNARTQAPPQSTTLTPLIISRRQPQNSSVVSRSSSAAKALTQRRHLRQQFNLHNCSHHQQHHQRHQRPKVIRASEYKNLRQVVPALRRQRDVGKVEVVTEAARYIDHLHKTLIERFVLCGIPDSLKVKAWLRPESAPEINWSVIELPIIVQPLSPSIKLANLA